MTVDDILKDLPNYYPDDMEEFIKLRAGQQAFAQYEQDKYDLEKMLIFYGFQSKENRLRLIATYLHKLFHAEDKLTLMNEELIKLRRN